jgi:hypothetical protein
MPKILCSVATRGRYFTTLPVVLSAVINQTRPVDKLVIFDDNDEPQDMRKESLYQNFFWQLESKGIEWEWQFAEKKGQHHIHQRANRMGYDWVWRVDDDAVPEPNVLENLAKHISDDVGAVGGSVLNPPNKPTYINASNKIDTILVEPNVQWGLIKEVKEVEHLYCSFIYRAGVCDFNLGLSRVAHREETLFTFGLHQKGYKLLVVPDAVTWHMKNPQGGIRDGSKEEMFEHDELIFRNTLAYRDSTVVVLNCGMGDHIVFNHVLPEIKNPVVFTCYPEIVPGRSIEEAQSMFGDLNRFNVYAKMHQWNWKDNLENAYRKLYL